MEQNRSNVIKNDIVIILKKVFFIKLINSSFYVQM